MSDETRQRMLARMNEIGREAFVDELHAQMRGNLSPDDCENLAGLIRYERDDLTPGAQTFVDDALALSAEESAALSEILADPPRAPEWLRQAVKS